MDTAHAIRMAFIVSFVLEQKVVLSLSNAIAPGVPTLKPTNGNGNLLDQTLKAGEIARREVKYVTTHVSHRTKTLIVTGGTERAVIQSMTKYSPARIQDRTIRQNRDSNVKDPDQVTRY